MSQMERFGLSDRVIGRIHAVLAGYPSIERAVIYGSRARGNYRAGSDIDLALMGAGVTERELLEVENCLDELFLPYTVDLNRYNALKNQDLINHIQRVGIDFYNADSEKS